METGKKKVLVITVRRVSEAPPSFAVDIAEDNGNGWDGFYDFDGVAMALTDAVELFSRELETQEERTERLLASYRKDTHRESNPLIIS